MGKYTEKMKTLSTILAASMIDHDTYEWPPVCALFAYQPQHPRAIQQEAIDHADGTGEEF